MMRALLMAGVLALPAAAYADTYQNRSLHDIPWYVAHRAETEATIKWCETRVDYAEMPDCRNAQHAAAAWIGQPRYGHGGFSYMHDPAFWAANPIARDGAAIQCARRAPGDEMMLPFCGAIIASKNLSR